MLYSYIVNVILTYIGILQVLGALLIYTVHILYAVWYCEINVYNSGGLSLREWATLAGELMLVSGIGLVPSLGFWQVMGSMDAAEAEASEFASQAERASHRTNPTKRRLQRGSRAASPRRRVLGCA